MNRLKRIEENKDENIFQSTPAPFWLRPQFTAIVTAVKSFSFAHSRSQTDTLRCIVIIKEQFIFWFGEIFGDINFQVLKFTKVKEGGVGGPRKQLIQSSYRWCIV